MNDPFANVEFSPVNPVQELRAKWKSADDIACHALQEFGADSVEFAACTELALKAKRRYQEEIEASFR